MKKTIIALLALSGIAMAAEYTGAITLPSASTYWHKGTAGDNQSNWADSTSNINITAASVYGTLVHPSNAAPGHIYYGCANGNNYASGDVVVSTNDDKSINFNTAARGGNGGEFVALTLSMDSVLAPRKTTADELVSVTFTFTNNVAAGAYSAWGYTNEATEVSSLAGPTATAVGENTFVLTADKLAELDELIFVIGNAKTNTQVTNLSVTATFAEKSVPEPTTGSLSLLALAGLCARRRKK